MNKGATGTLGGRAFQAVRIASIMAFRLGCAVWWCNSKEASGEKGPKWGEQEEFSSEN